MDKKDLLIEIGCEELPTQAVQSLAEQLTARLQAQLTASGLMGKIPAQPFATPRRLAVYIKEVNTQLPPQLVERTGPHYDQAFNADGKPTMAALGFAKSCGVGIEALSQKEGRLYFKSEKPAQKTMDILPDLIRQAIRSLPIAKPMRWGAHPDSFARPVHWLLVMFGSDIVPLTVFGLPSSNQTRGHRFHHPGALTMTTAKAYSAILEEPGKVIADFQERRRRIEQAIRHVTPAGQTVMMDPELLNEVTALVEWPVALVGHFDPDFLAVPPEALMTSMKVNQKYFPVLNPQGQLQPAFVLISNIEGKDPALIVHGNERVLNARLTDAAFFFKNDCAHSLESRLAHLEQVIFQKQLGSVADKTERIVKISAIIAEHIDADKTMAKQAAQLCKCDLLSEMVGEFPTLQGIMGYYYAKNDGLDEACALAIKEHYYPRFANDELPSNRIGCAVALADKLDTLVGIFGIHQPPSGDKDPFALRRAANGILAILLGKQLPLDLLLLLQWTRDAYALHLPNAQVIEQTFDFVMQRLKSICLEKGAASEQFEAVLACRPSQPLDFMHRLEAVRAFQKLPTAAALAAANKRVSNILKKQAGAQWPTAIDPRLFEHEAERSLAEALSVQTQAVEKLYAAGDYATALSQLSSLKEPVDRFFDKVMVMVDDAAQRNNRLALLARLHRLFTQVADISLLSNL
jgi:glycyl-tRNA synthetase beta chain